MSPLSLRTCSCLQVLDCLRNVGVGLDVDLPGAAEAVEVVDVQRAEVDLQRVEHLVIDTPMRLGLGAVDVQVQPRRVGAEAGEQALQLGLCSALGRRCRRRRPAASSRPAVAAVLDHDLEAARRAQALHRRAPKTLTRPPPISSLKSLAAARRRWRRPTGRGSWRCWKSSSMTYIEPKFERVGVEQERLPRDGDRVLDARRAPGDLLDACHHRLRPLDRRRVGQLHVDQQIALVLRRDEAGRRRA